MIEDLAVGKIAISYNVLGSYADARTEFADKIEVILPSEFPTTMMRTALVSANSTEQAAAISFCALSDLITVGGGGRRFA